MRVIGYTYEADYHCTDCAEERFPGISKDDGTKYEDSEGNEPHPIFDTDEWYANDIYEGKKEVVTFNCSDCGAEMDEVDLSE